MNNKSILLSIAFLSSIGASNASSSSYDFGIIQTGDNPEIYNHFVEIEQADITMKMHENVVSIKEEKIVDLERRINLLISRIESMHKTISTLSDVNKMLLSESTLIKNNDIRTQKDNKTLESKNKDQSSLIVKLNTSLASLKEELVSSSNKIKNSSKQITSLSNNIDKINGDKESLNLKLTSIQKDVEDKRFNIENLEASILEFESEFIDLAKKNSTKNDALEQDKKIKSLQVRVEMRDVEIEKLRNYADILELKISNKPKNKSDETIKKYLKMNEEINKEKSQPFTTESIEKHTVSGVIVKPIEPIEPIEPVTIPSEPIEPVEPVTIPSEPIEPTTNDSTNTLPDVAVYIRTEEITSEGTRITIKLKEDKKEEDYLKNLYRANGPFDLREYTLGKIYPTNYIIN